MNSGRPNATQRAVVKRHYWVQDEACSQAIRLLLTKAAAVTSTNGGDLTRRKVNTEGVSDVERKANLGIKHLT